MSHLLILKLFSPRQQKQYNKKTSKICNLNVRRFYVQILNGTGLEASVDKMVKRFDKMVKIETKNQILPQEHGSCMEFRYEC